MTSAAKTKRKAQPNGQPLREVCSTSRAMEYVSEPELTKQLGVPRDDWLLAITKEAVDNSLDACEEAGILPDVSVELVDHCLRVSDNGPGITPGLVERMLDFDSLTSSRSYHRCPTRGLLGNAAKAIFALPFVLNGHQGQTTITAQGWRHEVHIGLDAIAGRPVVEHIRHAEKVQNGTTVSINLSDEAWLLAARKMDDFVLFLSRYALLNPHCTIRLRSSTVDVAWTRTATKVPKWTAKNAEPVAWHDVDSFGQLALSKMRNDRDSGKDRLLRSFLREFAGLTRSDSMKRVYEETGIPNGAPLSWLLNGKGLDGPKTSDVLTAAQTHGTIPKPERLGVIGREHIRACLAEFEIDPDTLRYKRLVGDQDGMPFVVEVAFAEHYGTDDDLLLTTGLNFSPSIDESIVDDLEWWLSSKMVTEDSPVAVVVHIVTPSPRWLDKAKTRLNVDGDIEEAIGAGIVSVTKEWFRKRKSEDRDQIKKEPPKRKQKKVSLKAAVLRILPEAIELVSCAGQSAFSNRDLYYAARPMVQRHTKADLTQGWFSKVVDEYEIEHGLINGLERDPRGYLLEPHTGNKIPLGTRDVDEYEIPAHLYHTLIYVEKKGLIGRFEYGRIPERYDLAVIAAEGQAVRACKALIEAAQHGHKMKVLVFTDADPYGREIFLKISEATGAHRYSIEVVDAGLHLEEALEMGLEPETFSREKALSKDVVPTLTPLELEYFTGDQDAYYNVKGKPKVRFVECRRIELNALSADPDKFVAWIDKKLKEHGCDKKLVPAKKVVDRYAKETRDSRLAAVVKAAVAEAFKLDKTSERIVRELKKAVHLTDLHQQTETWARKGEPTPWTEHVETTVSRKVCKLTKEIRRLVAEARGMEKKT